MRSYASHTQTVGMMLKATVRWKIAVRCLTPPSLSRLWASFWGVGPARLGWERHEDRRESGTEGRSGESFPSATIFY